jgi:hypothetical protein
MCNVILKYCVSVAYNIQRDSNKIKLLMEYEDAIQGVLFGNAILAALMTFIFRRQFHFIFQF